MIGQTFSMPLRLQQGAYQCIVLPEFSAPESTLRDRKRGHVTLDTRDFLCVSVLRAASGPRVKLASCKSALNPLVVYSTDRSNAVVPVLVLLFAALWFILRGDLLYVFPCVILFLCFSVLLVLRLPRLGKRELILVLFVRLFDLCLFGFIGFLFLLGSGKGCVLWLWQSLYFSLTFFWCWYTF